MVASKTPSDGEGRTQTENDQIHKRNILLGLQVRASIHIHHRYAVIGCHIASPGGKRMEDIHSISFDLYRFDNSPSNQLSISSTMREDDIQTAPFVRGHGKLGFPKYVTWLTWLQKEQRSY